MRKLSIDQKDLYFAFENRMPETNHYLDLETGAILPVFSFNRGKILAEIEKNPDKYVRITPIGSRGGVQIMKDYIETVPKPQIRQELKEALTKKGAFRGFRVVIEKYPDEKEHWIEFKRNATLKLIKDWLANFGFELEFATNEKKYQRR